MITWTQKEKQYDPSKESAMVSFEGLLRDRLLDLYASGCVQLPSSVLLMHRTKCAPSSTSSLPWLTQAVTTLLRTPYSSAIAAVVYWIMFVAYGLALACYTAHTGGGKQSGGPGGPSVF